MVLGALEILGEGSGYDVLGELERKQIDKWTDIKLGSIYFAVKQLKKEAMITEVRQEQEGAFPVKSIYKVTSKGQRYFDTLQEEAFDGLYPYFYGFKAALKLNVRRSGAEIVQYARQAILKIEKILLEYKLYLESVRQDAARYENDAFFMRHDILLYKQERLWLQEVIDLYSERKE